MAARSGSFATLTRGAFELLEDGAVSVEGDGQRFRPWGFQGGEDGSPAKVVLSHSDGSSENLPSKIPYRQLAKGDRITAFGPCGGGYGDPMKRAPEDVLDDVLDGLLDAGSARVAYGVIIDGTRLDHAATQALRGQKA